MVKPAERKEVVKEMVSQGRRSERRACKLAGVSRSACRYESQRAAKDSALTEQMLARAERYPRYGYLMLHGLLKNEGLVVNKKRTYRLYKQAGLQLRVRKSKKLKRVRSIPATPQTINERWSMDFVHDKTSDSARRRTSKRLVRPTKRGTIQHRVTLLELPHQAAVHLVAQYLSQLIESRGDKPTSIVCDNGTEFTSKAMFHWGREHAVKLNFIEPGKPTQNAFVESFNGKFRDSCLNAYWFRSLEDARITIDSWRMDYNEVRPHSALGYQPPSVFAEKLA